ncbi:MAG: ATP-binding protein [Gammaproteobacteria bacterium]|nr:ATP-binding protein [Gammaproteobacteria bacterium]MCP4324174.1 ATP-binding protein [Alteromonadales bacterium]
MTNINGQTVNQEARSELSHLAPKNHIKGLLHTKEEAKKIPREFECEKHGYFKAKFSEVMNGKVMVNAVCNECIKEFDLLVAEKEQEILAKREKIKTEKQREARAEKLKGRGVGKRYLQNSFDNFNVDTPSKQNALLKTKELCRCIIEGEIAPNLLMVGGVGTGKTHLANAAVIELTDSGKDCGRVNLIDMVRRLKSTWSKDSEESEESVLKMYSSCDLLIIDEVGVQFNSDTEKMFVFDVINGRYEEELPTVIISNLDVAGVKEIIGDRCIDRLRQDGGKVIAFDWESQRA